MRSSKHISALASVVLVFCIGAIAGLFAAPSADAAGDGYIHWRNLETGVRTRAYVIPVETFGPGTGTTIGSGGVISSQAPNAGQLSNLVQTSSISSFIWPQRLFVRLVDGGGTDTLVCASATIHGRDQFGRVRVETVLTIDETGEYTNTVFEAVTRVVGTNCEDTVNGTPAGTDALTVQAPTRYLGMRGVFEGEGDFISVCLNDVSGDLVLCAELNDGGAADVQSAISMSKACGPNADERCFTIDVALSNLFQGVTPAADDMIHVQFRPRR